jgi:LmbE family N-acetylglucosaminyl deacetylase
MRMIQGNDSIRQWLNTMGVDRLLVLSPHLDDAVLSIAGLVRAAAERARVLTVFTESDAQVGKEWAQAAGFSDARHEHAERRLEDLRAMQYLGCDHAHAGLRSGELTDEAAERLLQGLLDTENLERPELLILLPAASGGSRPYTGLQKLRNRLLRLPFGSPAHPEHQQVRDRLWSAVSRRHLRVGFYADLPYAWRQSDAAIQAELEHRIGHQLEATHFHVDLPDKLAATGLYPSQMRLILGDTPAYKRRVLSRPECVFMVKRSSTAETP